MADNVLRTSDGEPIDLDAVDYHEIARSGDADVLEAFLQAGIDPERRDETGHTLLMIAVYADQEPTTTLLLKRGADPDGPDGQGNTPLMAMAFKGHVERARQLLDAGAQPNRKGPGGATTW